MDPTGTTHPSDPSDPAPAALPAWLLEILVCPRCRSTLRPDGGELACTDASCGLVYRIDDGIPVLLVDEARRR